MSDRFRGWMMDVGRRERQPIMPLFRRRRFKGRRLRLSYAEVLRFGFKHFIHSDKEPESENVMISSDEDEDDDSVKVKKSLLEVRAANFKELANAISHHTESYDRVTNKEERCLVIRRGQSFDFELTFDRPYNKETDSVSLVFLSGKKPNVCDGSRVVLPLSGERKSEYWNLKIGKQEGNTLNLKVTVPASCSIGKWYVKVNSVNKDDKNPALKEWQYTKPIYILFNPWCKDDTVYHPESNFLLDYVLEDEGGIYAGSKKLEKKWVFGQYEDPVLDCVIRILEINDPQLRFTSLSNPAQVVRKLTSVVNSCDNDGILTGNWSGDYSDGVKPTQWKGSVAILEQYFKTKEPVNYGQCWVFSGLLTTCCRALGIPARSVTNFDSAHDTDGSLTLDKFYEEVSEGEYKSVSGLSNDSIWNFHVWNDAWMARPDLQGECAQSGWQACDATPQEASNGTMRCGPCPLKALKEGLVNASYDGPFIFSEVNGDVVNWIREGFDFKVHSLNRHRVGSAILAYNKREGRIDVTNEYKYPGYNKEREVIKRAISCIPESENKKRVYGDIAELEPEVSIELVDIEKVLYGDPYDVKVKVTNLMKAKRNVVIHLASSSVYYTGVFYKKVKGQKFDHVLGAEESKVVKMTVTCEEYEPCIRENCNFKISTSCKVKETGRLHFQEDTFQLSKPVLSVKAEPSKVKIGQNVKVTVSFINSLPKDLTQCVLSVEGVGLQRPREIKIPWSVGARKTFQHDVDILPFKSRKDGPRTLVLDFDSNEMLDVKGSCEIFVTE